MHLGEGIGISGIGRWDQCRIFVNARDGQLNLRHKSTAKSDVEQIYRKKLVEMNLTPKQLITIIFASEAGRLSAST